MAKVSLQVEMDTEEGTMEVSINGKVIPNANYQYIAGSGIVSGGKGIPGEHILALAEDNLNEAIYLKSAKIIMRQAIDHLLGGREIKARALYGAN